MSFPGMEIGATSREPRFASTVKHFKVPFGVGVVINNRGLQVLGFGWCSHCTCFMGRRMPGICPGAVALVKWPIISNLRKVASPLGDVGAASGRPRGDVGATSAGALVKWKGLSNLRSLCGYGNGIGWVRLMRKL